MSTKKTFKVLCIDGGGIKGLYSATILNKIEEDLIKKTGKKNVRIVDYFDLICGTSTGGLIALALSAGISTKIIMGFYLIHGPKIFKRSKGLIPTLRQTLFYGKYSDKKIKNALTEIFNNKKIGDSKCLLCIPTFDLTHGTYEIFKYDHPEGNLSRDNKLLMKDVALATSAAPTFFPVAQMVGHENRQYVDGGVWANNPAIIGYSEALRYFVGEGREFNKIQLLSLSSLNNGMKLKPLARRRKSFFGWKSSLFDLALIGQSEFAHNFLASLQKNNPLHYFRVESSNIQSGHTKHIELDLASEESLALIEQFGNDMYHKIKHDIQPFFEKQKKYKTKNS